MDSFQIKIPVVVDMKLYKRLHCKKKIVYRINHCIKRDGFYMFVTKWAHGILCQSVIVVAGTCGLWQKEMSWHRIQNISKTKITFIIMKWYFPSNYLCKIGLKISRSNYVKCSQGDKQLFSSQKTCYVLQKQMKKEKNICIDHSYVLFWNVLST